MTKSSSALKVLFLAANPNDFTKLGLKKEWDLINNAVNASKYGRKRLVLIRIDQTTIRDWLNALFEHRPQIVHFAGHGVGDRGIIVCDENEDPVVLPPEKLKIMFSAVPVELVVLNACYTEVQAMALVAIVPKIVGMRQAAGDSSAQRFAEAFYRRLGDGDSVEDAFCQDGTAAILESMSEEDKKAFKPVLVIEGKAVDYDALCMKVVQSREVGGELDEQEGTRARNQRKLIRDRREQTNRLFELYAGEPDKLELGQHIRIGYSHQAWLTQGFPGAIDLDSLTVEEKEDYDPDRALCIKGFKEAAIYYRVSQGAERPYDGHCVRLSDWDTRQKLSLARAAYSDQFVTNQKEIVDTKLSDIASASRLAWSAGLSGTSLRDLSRLANGMLMPLNKSPLANTIGVAGTVVTREGYLFLPIRAKTKHFQGGYDGCSISRVVKWNDALLQNFGKALADQIIASMFSRDALRGVRMVSIQPLAFARELERAGKPQFFYHLWVENVGPDHINEANERWVRLFDFEVSTSASKAVAQAIERITVMLHKDEVITHDTTINLVLSEEARAGLYYLRRYLEAKDIDAFPRSWLTS